MELVKEIEGIEEMMLVEGSSSSSSSPSSKSIPEAFIRNHASLPRTPGKRKIAERGENEMQTECSTRSLKRQLSASQHATLALLRQIPQVSQSHRDLRGRRPGLDLGAPSGPLFISALEKSLSESNLLLIPSAQPRQPDVESSHKARTDLQNVISPDAGPNDLDTKREHASLIKPSLFTYRSAQTKAVVDETQPASSCKQ